MFETLILSSFAFLIGTSIGTFLSFGFNELYKTHSGIGMFFSPTKISIYTIITAFIFSVVFSLLAAYLPARIASRYNAIKDFHRE